MPHGDDFHDLARYYDPLMEHVDYRRWVHTCLALGALLPGRPLHLDAGCGTGVLLMEMRAAGWDGVGIDLSAGMLKAARRGRRGLPLAQADLRALPFERQFDIVTCLFDSINFLLTDVGIRGSIQQMANALKPGGVLYFDVVTERMVTDHFEDQDWTETIGAFTARWASAYDHRERIAETRIRINHGEASLIRERVYSNEFLTSACQDVGLKVLGVYDANTWRNPTEKSTRIDFVAMKDPPRGVVRRFQRVREAVQARLDR
jgi:SAM-dependent methyltransferase